MYSSGLVHPGYAFDGNSLHYDNIQGEYDVGKFIFSKFHHDQIIICINLFLENTLFGIGAKNYKNMLLGGWHPHNYSFQILQK